MKDFTQIFIRWIRFKNIYNNYSLESIISEMEQILNIRLFEFDLNDLSGEIERKKATIISDQIMNLRNSEEFQRLNQRYGKGVPAALLGHKNYMRFMDLLGLSNFENSDFKMFTSYSGKKGGKGDSHYNDFTNVYEKLNGLANIICSSDRYSKSIRKSPLNQGQNYEVYHWCTIYPKGLREHLEKKFGHVVFVDENGVNYHINGIREYINQKDLIQLSKETLRNFPLNQYDTLFEMALDIAEEITRKNYILENMGREIELTDKITLLKFKKQIILQGPPGTGKTRLAMQLAQAITGISNDDLSKSEQVEIVQFHPSFSYEDLVEGLKASTKGDMVVYQPENGVFKNFCLKALVAAISPQENTSLEDASFDVIFDKYVETLQSKIDRVFTKTKNNSELILVSANKNSIIVKYRFRDRLNETPGMRPFTISKQKLKKVVEKEINPENVSNITTELKPIVGHIAGVLFGVYRDLYAFMKGNEIALDDVQIEDYDFQTAFDEYWEQKENINFDNVKPFVFIIDEMNRANLSTVFGELISLMEDGKRIGADEAMSLKLPYSNDDFGIPKNLLIIGTMNTADRSVSQIDYAIRRRFAFVDVLPQNLTHDGSIEFDGELFVAVSRLFEDENGEHSKFLSPEFKPKEVQLGHSYFIKKNGEMKMRLDYEIKPILFEYIRDGILRETARTVIMDLKCSE